MRLQHTQSTILAKPSCLTLTQPEPPHRFPNLRACASQDYLKLATAGAACNAIVRFVLHPIDCVKTTVQAEMGKDMTVSDDDDPEGSEGGGGGDGWIGTVKGIVKNGGVGELTRGIDVSTVRKMACSARPPLLLVLWFVPAVVGVDVGVGDGMASVMGDE